MILMSEYFILRPKSCHLRSIGTSTFFQRLMSNHQEIEGDVQFLNFV